MTIGRREVLGSGLAMLAADVAVSAANAQSASSEGDSGGYGAAATGQQITRDFAKFLSAMRYEDLSPAAVHEAKRAVLDWTGCALAGSTHPTVGIVLTRKLTFVPASCTLRWPSCGRRLSVVSMSAMTLMRATTASSM